MIYILLLQWTKKETNKTIHSITRDFEYIYRRTFVRTLDKLRQKGYTDLSKVEACTYRATEFAPLRELNFENRPGGRANFIRSIESAKTFYAVYYKVTDAEKLFGTQKMNLYRRLKDAQKKSRTQVKDLPKEPVKVMVSTKLPENMQPRPIPSRPAQQKPQQPVQQPKESPQHAKVTPIPKKPNGNDDGPIFGDF